MAEFEEMDTKRSRGNNGRPIPRGIYTASKSSQGKFLDDVKYVGNAPAVFRDTMITNIKVDMFETATMSYSEAEAFKGKGYFVTRKKNGNQPIYVIWKPAYAELRRRAMDARTFKEVTAIDLSNFKGDDFKVSVRGSRPDEPKFYATHTRKVSSKQRAAELVYKIKDHQKFRQLAIVGKGYWKEKGAGTHSRYICQGETSRGKTGYFWINHGVSGDLAGREHRFYQAIFMEEDKARAALAAYEQKMNRYRANEAKLKPLFEKNREHMRAMKQAKVGYIMIRGGTTIHATFPPLVEKPGIVAGTRSVQSDVFVPKTKKFSVYLSGGALKIKLKGHNLTGIGLINRKIGGIDNWANVKTHTSLVALDSQALPNKDSFDLFVSRGGRAEKAKNFSSSGLDTRGPVSLMD